MTQVLVQQGLTPVPSKNRQTNILGIRPGHQFQLALEDVVGKISSERVAGSVADL